MNSPSPSVDSRSNGSFSCVISLCDARNKTTSPFSFFIGTMSSIHLNGVPENKKKFYN